jgi:hypothetical protein
LSPHYVYVLVRTDIPLADQMVQVGHACLEAGRRFEQPDEPCHLVLLAVSSERDLQFVVEEVELIGVHWVVFHEPDDNLGLTVACTEPIRGTIRRALQHLPLWQPHVLCHGKRDPPAYSPTSKN